MCIDVVWLHAVDPHTSLNTFYYENTFLDQTHIAWPINLSSTSMMGGERAKNKAEGEWLEPYRQVPPFKICVLRKRLLYALKDQVLSRYRSNRGEIIVSILCIFCAYFMGFDLCLASNTKSHSQVAQPSQLWIFSNRQICMQPRREQCLYAIMK